MRRVTEQRKLPSLGGEGTTGLSVQAAGRPAWIVPCNHLSFLLDSLLYSMLFNEQVYTLNCFIHSTPMATKVHAILRSFVVLTCISRELA